MYKLIIFDLDGTLAEFKTGAILPNVAETLAALPCPYAIASNQGGVGLRHWMEQGGFGEPHLYPTEASIQAHFAAVLSHLPQPYGPPPVAVCYAYQSTKTGKWGPVPMGQEERAEWASNCRKPAPGLLQALLIGQGLKPEEALMVGDGAEDEQAAHAAGCAFEWAAAFFQREA